MALFRLQACESLKDLDDVDVVYFVHFDQIFEQHENNVGEKSCLPAEGRIQELSKYLSH